MVSAGARFVASAIFGVNFRVCECEEDDNEKMLIGKNDFCRH